MELVQGDLEETKKKKGHVQEKEVYMTCRKTSKKGGENKRSVAVGYTTISAPPTPAPPPPSGPSQTSSMTLWVSSASRV